MIRAILPAVVRCSRCGAAHDVAMGDTVCPACGLDDATGEEAEA
jgi:rubrerythrin